MLKGESKDLMSSAQAGISGHPSRTARITPMTFSMRARLSPPLPGVLSKEGRVKAEWDGSTIMHATHRKDTAFLRGSACRTS